MTHAIGLLRNPIRHARAQFGLIKLGYLYNSQTSSIIVNLVYGRNMGTIIGAGLNRRIITDGIQYRLCLDQGSGRILADGSDRFCLGHMLLLDSTDVFGHTHYLHQWIPPYPVARGRSTQF